MVNKEIPNNLTAEGFFGGGQITTPEKVANSDFSEALRDQVLQAYLNYDGETLMGESSPAVAPQDVTATKLPFWKKKPALLLAGYIALIVIVFLGIIIFVMKPQSQSKNNLRGEVAYVEGVVNYKTKDGSWQVASIDTVLDEGASLQVSGEGRAIINLDDGSSLRLNDNSTITLTSMDPAHTIINNDRGEVYSRVMKASRTFDVVANGITYRSLGTAYKTLCEDVTDPEGTEGGVTNEKTTTLNGVEVYESKVQILGVNGNNEIVVQQGEKYYVVNVDAPELANKVTEVAVSDIQLDEFVMWNKEQDEKVETFKNQMGVLFDIKVPDLAITSPADGDSTTSDKIIISGTTETDAKLTINDVSVTNNHGSFSYEFALNMGTNGVKVIAVDAAGNKSVRNLTITRTDPAALPTTTPNPTATTTTTVPAGSKISLSGTKVNDGVSLTWNVSNLDVSKGFKIVKSTSANPVYPGNDYQYLTNGNTRNYTWNIKDGKTYHFRICQYNGNGACLVYSNDITVTAPTVTVENKCTAISASASGSNKVNWSVTGVSQNGFKVVWSKTSMPTYPNRSSDRYQYFGDSSRRTSDTLDAFDGYGTYYVRVCAYENGDGTCGPYSGQVTLTLGTPTTDNN